MTQPLNGRRPINAIRWWWVALFACLTALATWGATWWLLTVAGHSADLRVQAIQSGLTVAAGTGGAAALLLAARRQWLQERDQSHREETDAANQSHQQRQAALMELDATERRITDLYMKAVDQLGSEKAPVRLGGLYALERLAQDTPNQRQTIVNVICAYLRMPYSPPQGQAGRNNAAYREEMQVRLTAQRVLAVHLNRSDPAKLWNDIGIDLTGATLVKLDFSGCIIASLSCVGSTFLEGADFSDTEFAGVANYCDAIFWPNDKGVGDPAATFMDAIFRSKVEFTGAKFKDKVEFNNAKFIGDAELAAHFQSANFYGATFEYVAWFVAATFDGQATFSKATFNKTADFTEVTFTQEGNRFFAAVDFGGAVFAEKPSLSGASIVRAVPKPPRLTPESIRAILPKGWMLEMGTDDVGRLIYKPNQ